MLPEVLLNPKVGLVTGLKPVLNVPGVPREPAVPGEVAGKGGERYLVCDVGESREDDVMALKGSRGDGDVVSWSEAGLDCDTTSELMSIPKVTTELAET